MTHSVLEEYARCAAAFRNSDGPEGLYRAVEGALGRLIGHQLFTLLIVVGDGTEVERVWTSNPQAYPLTGRKAMGPTPWGDHVLGGRNAWLGNDAEAIRWAFPDHELITGLGLGSCINVPVVAFGRTLGTMNILDSAGAYLPEQVDTASLFAPLLALPFQNATGGSVRTEAAMRRG